MAELEDFQRTILADFVTTVLTRVQERRCSVEMGRKQTLPHQE